MAVLYSGLLWFTLATALTGALATALTGTGPTTTAQAALAVGVVAAYLVACRIVAARLPAAGTRRAAVRAYALSLLDVATGLGVFFLLGANLGWGAPLRLIVCVPLAVRLPLRQAVAITVPVAVTIAAAPFLPAFRADPAYAFFRTPNAVAAGFIGCLLGMLVFSVMARVVGQRDVLLRERDSALAAERASHAEAEQRAGELGALVEVARAISGRLATEDVLVEVQAQLNRVLPFDSYFVALRDPALPAAPDQAALRYAVVFDGGRRYRDQEGTPVAARADAVPAEPSPRAYTSRVLAQGEPLLVLRTTEELAALAIARDTDTCDGRLGDVARPSASLLYAPLRSGDDVFGVLSVQSYDLDAYTGRHLALVDAVARQVAVALQNARLAAQVGEADALRSLSRLKDQLIATVSHELRTPLTYIYGYSEMLAMGTVPLDRMARVAGEIHQAAEHMRHILDDVLDLERLQAGTLTLNVAEVALAGIVDEAIRLLGPSRAGRILQIEIPDDLPLLYADRHRVVQVMVNLLVNAARYSPAGTAIRVCAARQGDRQILVQVADHGPGLNETQRERIFEKFYRGPAEVTSRHPGAGLGLPICRGLVEAHGRGCRIWAESDGPGKGSRFFFTLPAAIPARGQDAVAVAPEIAPAAVPAAATSGAGAMLAAG